MFTRPASLASRPPETGRVHRDASRRPDAPKGTALSESFAQGRCRPCTTPRLLDTAIQVNSTFLSKSCRQLLRQLMQPVAFEPRKLYIRTVAHASLTRKMPLAGPCPRASLAPLRALGSSSKPASRRMGHTLQAQGQTGEIGLAKGRPCVLERQELPSQPTWMIAQRAENPRS